MQTQSKLQVWIIQVPSSSLLAKPLPPPTADHHQPRQRRATGAWSTFGPRSCSGACVRLHLWCRPENSVRSRCSHLQHSLSSLPPSVVGQCFTTMKTVTFLRRSRSSSVTTTSAHPADSCASAPAASFRQSARCRNLHCLAPFALKQQGTHLQSHPR